MRVLIVDDSRDTARTFSLLARRHGFDADFCLQADEAVARIETWRPDVLLLDLAMPHRTGFDLIEEFQRRPALRPACVVAVTGYGDQAMRERAAAAGFDYFLLKPVEWTALKEVLDDCCAKA